MDNNMTFLNACRNGQKSIVQIFLKKGGIDVNKRDAEGNTPLYYACLKAFCLTAMQMSPLQTTVRKLLYMQLPEAETRK